MCALPTVGLGKVLSPVDPAIGREETNDDIAGKKDDASAVTAGWRDIEEERYGS